MDDLKAKEKISLGVRVRTTHLAALNVMWRASIVLRLQFCDAPSLEDDTRR